MNEMQQKKLEDDWEVDFSFGMQDMARFRVNVFMQRGTVSAALRRIAADLLTFDDLGLPPVVKEMSERPNGLVLVTGPTGCGKSTTLAAMIDRINDRFSFHIITIEDPIEYLHHHKKSTIDQREVYSDTKSFQVALKSILRQNPDVVLLGEMRDMESIQAALTIAETGHLCFATLHTNSCSQTLARIVDVFPGDKQQQVRTQLSMCIQGVLTQVLLPKMELPAGGGTATRSRSINFPMRKWCITSFRPCRLQISAMRALGAYHNVFSIESFMDELASAAVPIRSNSG